MVNKVSCYQKAALAGLSPLLARLSAGTEMSSYGEAQWNFLLDGGDVTAFVAEPDDASSDRGNDGGGGARRLDGCLLRIHLHQAGTVGDAGGGVDYGFGMMLVSPDARGRGVARSLLDGALSAGPGGCGATSRKMLPVCTAAGQSVYKKLGFRAAGRVTALSTTVEGARNIPLDAEEARMRVRTYGNTDLHQDTTGPAPPIDPAMRNLFIAMDAKATGYDRTERLSRMLENDPACTARSILATATTAGSDVVAAAILRREQPGGPFVIGPMMGTTDAALPLVRALAASVMAERDDGTRISILLSDHLDLVERFRAVNFESSFDFPAMTLDGRPIYDQGDGSYLSIIHPTLG